MMNHSNSLPNQSHISILLQEDYREKSCSEPHVDYLDKFLEPDKVTVKLSDKYGLIVDEEKIGNGHNSVVNFEKGVNRNKSLSQQQKKGWRKYGGIIFGLCASFFFSLTVLLAKVLKDHGHHPFSICVWRYLGILAPALPIVIYYKAYKKTPIFETVWPLTEFEKLKNFSGLMLRGFLGCTSVIFRFYSLKYLTVADSSVISYSGPVFVTILAHFCLKEKCGLISVFLATLTAFGVVVIARPPILTGSSTYDSGIMIGTALALASMFCASTVIILMRKIRQVHFALMLLAFGAWGVFESAILAVPSGVMTVPTGKRDILLTVTLALLTFAGQYSIIIALKFEQAGPVALIRTCDVIFSFIWQFIFLSVYPDIYSLIGATIVVLAVLITGFRKWLTTLPIDSKARKRFWIVLK